MMALGYDDAMNRKRRRLRWKPKRYSKARVYGTLNGWTKWAQIHGRKQNAPTPRDWGLQ